MEMESSEVLSSLSTEDWELRAECMLRYPGGEGHRPSQNLTKPPGAAGICPRNSAVQLASSGPAVGNKNLEIARLKFLTCSFFQVLFKQGM